MIKGHSEREYQTPTNVEGGTTATKKDVSNSRESYKCWATERSIGRFQRVFKFASRVNQDNVKANLRNGILSIVVPKETSFSSKKITVE